jgi:hypothetical protein
VTKPALQTDATFDQPSAMLRVAPYEQVAGLLLALIVMSALGVVVLGAAWLSGQVTPAPLSSPVALEMGAGGQLGSEHTENLLIEAPDTATIGASTDLAEPQVQHTMAQVLDALAVTQVDLSEPQTADATAAGGPGGTIGLGNYPSIGPISLIPGRPREQRWVINYQEGASLEGYAEQLDWFKIELGVVGNGRQIQYARKLSVARPETRTGSGDQEERLYFVWRDGDLKRADLKLLKKAGIETTPSTIVVHFFDATLESRLATLEYDYAGRAAKDIRRTRFGVRKGRGDEKYEFYVIDQQ